MLWSALVMVVAGGRGLVAAAAGLPIARTAAVNCPEAGRGDLAGDRSVHRGDDGLLQVAGASAIPPRDYAVAAAATEQSGQLKRRVQTAEFEAIVVGSPLPTSDPSKLLKLKDLTSMSERRYPSRANLAQTSQETRLPLVARSPYPPDVVSNTYRPLPLVAVPLGRFEPRRPRHSFSIIPFDRRLR